VAVSGVCKRVGVDEGGKEGGVVLVVGRVVVVGKDGQRPRHGVTLVVVLLLLLQVLLVSSSSSSSSGRVGVKEGREGHGPIRQTSAVAVAPEVGRVITRANGQADAEGKGEADAGGVDGDARTEIHGVGIG